MNDQSFKIPTRLFDDPAFRVGALFKVVFYAGVVGFFLVVTIYLQSGQGFSTLGTGLASFVYSIDAAIAASTTHSIAAADEASRMRRRPGCHPRAFPALCSGISRSSSPVAPLPAAATSAGQGARVACISQTRTSVGSVAVTRWPPVAVKRTASPVSSCPAPSRVMVPRGTNKCRNGASGS